MTDSNASITINDQEISERLSFLQLNARDLDLLKALHQTVKGRHATFIDDFYTHLQHFDSTRNLLTDPELVKRLKLKQETYFDRLTAGNYDADYVQDRVNVGSTHHRIGLKPQWYVGAYHYYLAWLLPEIERQLAHDETTRIDTIQAIVKVILFDIELALDAYFQADHEMMRLLAEVFQNNIEGVIITDTRRQILHANTKVTTIAGYRNEDLIGQPVTLMLPAQEREAFIGHWQEIKQGEPWQGECMLQHSRGTLFPAWVNVSCVKDDAGAITHFIVEFSDISAFRAAQKALAKRTEELARSNKELEQFAYVASHDLQEPLRMVASFTQLLSRRYRDKLDSDADEFIHYAVDGATRMQTLINDLLAYSRIGSRIRPFEPVDLSNVLKRALANLHIAIEESGAQISYDELPTVRGDITQLTQLFQNLIGNAVKFRREQAPEIRISVLEDDDDYWRIAVRDNGIGIAPEFFERIFVIFQRLHNKEEYPGTGIGLSICKKIVERHGGQIRVDSERGQGATFTFTLPKTLTEETD
ncbi:MAG: protoglobin domain-containing protein [Methylobacter sp.]